jgi:hypothetical protein
MAFHTHISHGGWTIGLLAAAVQRRSLTRSTWTTSLTENEITFCIPGRVHAHEFDTEFSTSAWKQPIRCTAIPRQQRGCQDLIVTETWRLRVQWLLLALIKAAPSFTKYKQVAFKDCTHRQLSLAHVINYIYIYCNITGVQVSRATKEITNVTMETRPLLQKCYPLSLSQHWPQFRRLQQYATTVSSGKN